MTNNDTCTRGLYTYVYRDMTLTERERQPCQMSRGLNSTGAQGERQNPIHVYAALVLLLDTGGR